MVCLTGFEERDKKNIQEFVENRNQLEEVGATPTLSRNGEAVGHLNRG